MVPCKSISARQAPLDWHKMTSTVVVNDKMQRGYRYVLSQPAGRNFDAPFEPDLTPAQMLELGVFGGKYLTDCRDEFPANWFESAKLSPEGSDPKLNCFGVAASQPLSVWRAKGGSIRTIRAAGSSGTAATGAAGECPRRMRARSAAGRRCAATSRRSAATASRATCSAAAASARRSSTGPTTAARSDLASADCEKSQDALRDGPSALLRVRSL
jgi:hypothetical protein